VFACGCAGDCGCGWDCGCDGGCIGGCDGDCGRAGGGPYVCAEDVATTPPNANSNAAGAARRTSRPGRDRIDSITHPF
jgi:hypothetical protein